jgi:uncharacterized protein GlcG (DUF336 family)
LRIRSVLLLSAMMLIPAFAQADSTGCLSLPAQAALKAALIDARKADNGGLNLDMWAAVVDRSGIVCAIAYSGKNPAAQWPLSRVIAAQKANTANGLSLDASALSTANLYSGVQPGGFLYGLQESNPVDTHVAYRGAAADFGTPSDPMVGGRIGGVNVFGGGLALYNGKGEMVGALGTSGDTSCADHNISWRMRAALKLDYVPGGVSPQKNDQIIYDLTNGKSTSGFGHPTCIGSEKDIAAKLPATRKPPAPE